MSESPVKIYIKELNTELIPPSTSKHGESDQGGSKIVVIGKPGCFSPGTRILMYNGEVKNVENVCMGDKLMGDDSTCRNVLELCNNTDEMYKIIPKNGESYTVNKLHKLVLIYCGYKKEEIIEEITVEHFLKKPKTVQNKWAIFRAGVEFDEQKTDLDPYILGLLISDKNPKLDNSSYLNVDKKYFKTYENIPTEYKINSLQNRVKLLAGILDMKGSYESKSYGFTYINTRKSMFDDVVYLGRSIGLTVNTSIVTKTFLCNGERKIKEYFKCFIYGNVNIIPCKLINIEKRVRKHNHLISRFTIEPQGEGEYFGFTLDGNHRFLLDTFDVVRNTGKSTLIASILYSKKHIYPVGMVFSGTEDSNGFYKRIFPDTFIYGKYDEGVIEQFVKRQKIAKSHCHNPWAVILIDDCTDDPRIFNKPLQQGMYKRGRHWKMFYILSLQYCMDVKPVIRTNVDGTFILREPNLKNRRSLWENYAGVIPDFSQFCDIMDQLTDNYTALYINNANQSNILEECLYWYKATPVPESFKFGCKDYWDFHDERYNQDYVEPFLP
jgi:hypothetical protein